MAIKIKLYQHKRKALNGKWYGRTVKTGEVTTEELARRISAANSVTESDVYGVIVALVQEMKSARKTSTCASTSAACSASSRPQPIATPLTAP